MGSIFIILGIIVLIEGTREACTITKNPFDRVTSIVMSIVACLGLIFIGLVIALAGGDASGV